MGIVKSQPVLRISRKEIFEFLLNDVVVNINSEELVTTISGIDFRFQCSFGFQQSRIFNANLRVARKHDAIFLDLIMMRHDEMWGQKVLCAFLVDFFIALHEHGF